MKRNFLILILIVIIASIVFVYVNRPYPPTLTIISTYDKKEAVIGAYSWKRLCKAVSVDLIGPRDYYSYYQPIMARKGDEVELYFSDNPISITAECISDDNISKCDSKNNTLKLPQESGIYTYNVIAQYRQGRVAYWFKTEIN